MKRIFSIPLALALVLSLSLVAVVAVPVLAGGWSDNFNGGPQWTWVNADYGNNTTFQFINNRYELHTEYLGGGYEGAAVSYVDCAMPDSVMQVKVQQINPGDKFLAYLIARGNVATNQFYCLGVSSGDPSVNNEPHLWLGKFNGATYTDLGGGMHHPWGIGNYTWYDCYIKFDISGSNLRGKVWKVGDPEPAGWLVTGTDSDYTSGVAGVMVATYYYTYNTYGIVQAAFDDAVIASETPCGAGGATVGYETYPINKINLIAPWLALAVAIVAGGAYLVRRRARSHA